MKATNKIQRAAYGSQGPTKMVSIRMPVSLIERLAEKSKAKGVSKNSLICSAIESAIKI